METEEVIANFEKKKLQLITEANLYANDMTVPLSISMELYSKIDRLGVAIKQLKNHNVINQKETRVIGNIYENSLEE